MHLTSFLWLSLAQASACANNISKIWRKYPLVPTLFRFMYYQATFQSFIFYNAGPSGRLNLKRTLEPEADA
jgi:hypothetical protein